MAQSYYELLQEQVANYKGEIVEVGDIPNFFRVLSDLLNRELDTEDRQNICAALAYLVAPKDAIPEEVFGSAGYVDDLFICVYVLDRIHQKHGLDIMEDLWRGDDGKFLEYLNSALESSTKFVDVNNFRKEIFEFVGLE